MMRAECNGRYVVRMAENEDDLRAVQHLRYAAFIAGRGAAPRLDGRDSDAFDGRCSHVMIEDSATGDLVACFRLLLLGSGADIHASYSAQYYELDGLKDYAAPMVEMGRFCVEPGKDDPDILRLAWRALAAYVEANKVEMLFGCSSFAGIDEAKYTDAFAMLRDQHVGPKKWLPRVKAPKVFQFAMRLGRAPNRVAALRTMPPLLRSYLTMGGWVSDHAVVDTDLNTLHVFTGLEISAIPPRRRAVILGSAS